MPVITASMIPTVAAGNLFETFSTSTTLNIRWLTALDPVHYEVTNRPMADIAIRQFILAKALDQVNANLSYTALFPFLLQPKIQGSTSEIDVPVSLIWDINISAPKKWRNIRLAKIKRISGTNGTTDTYSGKLRLIFTAVQTGSTTETAILQADYEIDSTLTYQKVALSNVSSTEETNVVPTSEQSTITGDITFSTLNTTATTVIAFLDAVAPPSNTTTGTDGLYLYPEAYELLDSTPDATDGDYSVMNVSHGTGMLTNTAYNLIPPLDTTVQSWVENFNYPFASDSTLTATNGTTIPIGLFKEFNITAPAGDNPTGDNSGEYYPVWISRIERVDETSTTLKFYFATYNVTTDQQSTEGVEFATLELTNTMVEDQLVAINSISNLYLKSGSTSSLYNQELGRGHVVLSSMWSDTSSTVDDFFEDFELISDNPADIEFAQSSTRISSYGITRVPRTIPTIGQWEALSGTISTSPSSTNRFVVEQDTGKGEQVDLEALSDVTSQTGISRYGWSGGLVRKSVIMEVDNSKLPNDANFYVDEILPRLTALLGRAPIHGDEWYDGISFKRYNGKSWIT